MGFLWGKKEERVERTERNAHNRLGRNIMLGEQAHGEARRRGGAVGTGILGLGLGGVFVPLAASASDPLHLMNMPRN